MKMILSLALLLVSGSSFASQPIDQWPQGKVTLVGDSAQDFFGKLNIPLTQDSSGAVKSVQFNKFGVSCAGTPVNCTFQWPANDDPQSLAVFSEDVGHSLCSQNFYLHEGRLLILCNESMLSISHDLFP